MTPASVTHVKRGPTVTPTQSMAKQSAPVPQVTQGQPATWILTSVPLVSIKQGKLTRELPHTVCLTSCIFIVLGANPCEHGGRCLNTKGSFQCKCLQGYEGPRCEMDVNECMSNPCHNDATCLDQIGGFHCICMPGKREGELNA